MARVALAGVSKTGKTTLVRGLMKLGYIHVNYTDYLKYLLSEALQSIGVEVSMSEIIRDKEKWRPLLIEWGHVVGFDEGAYVKQVLRDISSSPRGHLGNRTLPKNIVFDQVKQPAQWHILNGLNVGFKLIRLTCRDDTRIVRGMVAEDMPPMEYQPGEIVVHTDGYTPTEVLDVVRSYVGD